VLQATTKRAQKPKSSLTGFSLIETTIALGIVAFALVPLIALIPLGLQAQRDSIEQTTARQIFQAVIGEIRRADFNTLISGTGASATGTTFRQYFDDQARVVEADDPARQYDVYVEIIYPYLLPSDASQEDVYAGARATCWLLKNPDGFRGQELNKQDFLDAGEDSLTYSSVIMRADGGL